MATHATPEDAVCIHKEVRSKASLGIHFGTFAGSEDEVGNTLSPRRSLDSPFLSAATIVVRLILQNSPPPCHLPLPLLYATIANLAFANLFPPTLQATYPVALLEEACRDMGVPLELKEKGGFGVADVGETLIIECGSEV